MDQYIPTMPLPERGNAQPSPEWEVESVILDLYEVKALVGIGGMGQVYKVHHRGWNVDLAVKCPRPEIFNGEGGKDQFIREAETWVNLSLHPHVVSCYYVRTLGSTPRVFAEYVAGGSLRKWIAEGWLYQGEPVQALERMLDAAIQFAWGLQHAHAEGLVHQDVKPDNAMMTPEGTLKVTDFGLARARQMAGRSVPDSPSGRDVTASGTWAGLLKKLRRSDNSPHATVKDKRSPEGMLATGTPQYRSPEQGRGEPLSYQTDLWSWGLSVLQMFAGKLTWTQGEDAPLALQRYVEEGPACPGIPAMPADLVALLKQCFDPKPINRPENLATVADILQRIYGDVAGEPYRRRLPKAADTVAATLNNRALSLLDLATTERYLFGLDTGKVKEAMECWRMALQADPTHLESTFNLGYLQWDAGQVDDAWFMRRVAALEPLHKHRPEYWAQMAAFQAERGDRSGVEHALAQMPSDGTSGALPGAYPDFHLIYTWKLAAGISALALSSDGRQMLVGGTDKQVSLFDVATHACLITFATPRCFEVNALAFSVRERYALTGGFSEEVTIWDLQSREQDGTLTHTTLTHPAFKKSSADSISTFVFSQRNGLLAWTCRSELPLQLTMDQPIWLWDLRAGQFADPLVGHKHSVFSIAFSPDGQYLLSGGRFLGQNDQVMKLWDVGSRRYVRSFVGHAGSVKAVTFAPDGQYAISGSDDTTLKVWEVQSARPVRTMSGHTNAITSLAVSADGACLVSASEDKTVRIWDLCTGKCVRTLDAHEDTVTSVIFSPNGSVFFSGSRDGTVRMWSMHWSTSPRAEYLVSVPVSSGEAIENRERVENFLEEADALARKGSHQAAYRLLRDAQQVPGYDKSVQILDRINQIGKMMHRADFGNGWLVRTFKGHTGAIHTIGFSPDGRYALSGSRDRSLRLWDLQTGTSYEMPTEHCRSISVAAFSPDGRYAVSGDKNHYYKGDRDECLWLWDLTRRQPIGSFHDCAKGVSSAVFMPDGKSVFTGTWSEPFEAGEASIRRWDIRSRECVQTLKGHEDVVEALALSGDAKLLLSASRDTTLRLWKVSSGECIRVLTGHTGSVLSAAITLDGRYALSAGVDEVVRLWDLYCGECVARLLGHADSIHTVKLTPDAAYAVSAGEDAILRLWDLKQWRASSPKCLKAFEGHVDAIMSVAVSPDGRYCLSAGQDAIIRLWELDWAWDV